VDVTYELTLTPVEDEEHQWEALIYRSVRAGVCGPWTGHARIVQNPGYWAPLREIAEQALSALNQLGDFEIGEPVAHASYGRVYVAVPLTRKETRHMVPVIPAGGGLEWVDAGPVRFS
jgi:hypothetical protein